MISAILFWMAKTLAEIIMALLVLISIGALWFAVSLPGILCRKRCTHPRYRETRACSAICTSCGQNLGFVGTVREDKSKVEVW